MTQGAELFVQAVDVRTHATGDKGEVHRVTPAGQGAVYFSSDETHARSLVVDGRRRLLK